MKSVEECVRWKAKYPISLSECHDLIKKSINSDSIPRVPGCAGIGLIAEIEIYRALFIQMSGNDVYKSLDLTHLEIDLGAIIGEVTSTL